MTEIADVGIKGIQELLDANLRRIAALQPSGVVGRAIKSGLIEAHRYAVGITHVWHYKGGGLRASHRMELQDARGVIFIDPSTVNPRGQRPAEYGPYEHDRGGEHAFYQRTADEAGPGIAARAAAMIVEELMRR